MSLHGTVLPSTEDTRSYLIGWWCFLSSCRKDSFSALRTAERSSTGMFTSPNARAPFQMDAIVPPLQGSTRAIHHLCTLSTESGYWRARPVESTFCQPVMWLSQARYLHDELSKVPTTTEDAGCQAI